MLDIIFKDGKPIEAVPGGSTFNGIISLGRAGVNATFISETGSDRVGEYVRQFLKQNNVDTASVNVYPDSKSPVSLAFLDDDITPTTSSIATSVTTTWTLLIPKSTAMIL